MGQVLGVTERRRLTGPGSMDFPTAGDRWQTHTALKKYAKSLLEVVSAIKTTAQHDLRGRLSQPDGQRRPPGEGGIWVEACIRLGSAGYPPSLSSFSLWPFCSDLCSRRSWGGGPHQYPGVHHIY